MKKNKTIAYMLAATLLVGGTFVGTKAYFTDEDDAKADLVISMGDVDVSVDETKGWVYESTVHGKQEATPFRMLEKDSFMNVKPGDKFVKEVTIKNGSGIDTDLAISGGDVKSGTELDKAIKDGFIKVDNNINEVIEDLNNNDNHDPWGTNEEKTATLKIVVEIQSRVPDQDNNYNSNGGETIDFDFAKEMNPFVINATQEIAK